MSNDDKSLAHTRWNCKYHLVFTPKYRRKVIYGQLRLLVWMEFQFILSLG